VPGFTGTVHFTVSNPLSGESVPADYTFTTIDGGTHTFTNGFTLLGAGNRTITATDDCSNFTASAIVAVKAPHFTITAPASVAAGRPSTVPLAPHTPADPPRTGSTGTANFAVTDSGTGVAYPTSYPFTAGDGGTHTFTNAFQFVTVGPQSITATDS